MTKQGKNYRKSAEQLDKTKTYSPREAVGLVKSMAYAKFDETVELHLRMGVDPRNADQQVRGVALLPHGLGKKIRILVFAEGEAEKIAKEAGADYAGGEDLIKKIEGGWLEFDTTVATREMMGQVGKLGKILGRKGLMPNPKLGTVVSADELPRVIEDAGKGRVEFKLDRTAIIHVPVGKVGFDDDKLEENLMSMIEAVMKAKPSGLKGHYIKTVVLTSAMGPGIKLDLKIAVDSAAG